MKAIIYTRMSNEDRDKKKFSPVSQANDCKAYAKRNDIEIVGVLSDEISGVYPLEDRPGGRQLLAMAAQIDAVIVYRLDRLGRPDFATWDYGFVMNIISQLAQLGVQVHDIENGPIRNNLGDITMAFIKSLVSAEERKAIRKRTMDGRMDAARSGKWVGGGAMPFGLDRTVDGIIIHETEAATIRRAYDLYLKQNLSFNEIARLFTSEGIATKNGLSQWHPSTVTRMMTKRHVIGELWYKGVMVPCPAIVTDDEFAAVTGAKRAKFTRRDGATIHNYLLSGGRLKCTCGSTMGGVYKRPGNGKTYKYYTCASHSRRWMMSCTESPVNADNADVDVWAKMVQLFETGELRELVAAELKEQSAEVDDIAARRETLRKQAASKRRKIGVLLDAFADADPIIAEAKAKQIKQLSTEIQTLEREAGRLTVTDNTKLLNEIDTITEHVRAFVIEGGRSLRRDLLDAMGVQCYLVHQEGGRAINAEFFC